jgi:hypothetical protein
MKLKHIIHSEAYGAMVSWTHLVEKLFDSNGLMDHSTGFYRRKNADGNSFTDPSYTANSYPSYLLTVLQKID